VTIRQLERQLKLVNSEIATATAQLAELKKKRRGVTAQLAALKKAVKRGEQPANEPEGITEKLTTILNETVAEPIAEMLGLADEPKTPPGPRPRAARKSKASRRVLKG